MTFAIFGVGKIVSDLKEEGKISYCALNLNLDENSKVKLFSYSKAAKELLIKDTYVFIIGDLSYIDDTFNLQVEARNICPIEFTGEKLPPVYVNLSGRCNFLDIRENYCTFSCGSYNGLTKKYTNASVISSHPLAPYVNKAKVSLAGVLNTRKYNSKNGERHSLDIQARSLCILSSSEDNNVGTKKVTKNTDSKLDEIDSIESDINDLDNMPF